MICSLDRWLACGLFAMLIAGSAWAAGPKADPQCLAGAPAGLEAHWTALCSSPKRDLVLHQLRAGQAALATGHLPQAEEQFDAALGAIEAVYADNEGAEKARSVWNAEKVKDFKGEPYERVMAFHYRGLLYLLAGDFDNAQASFKGAVLQDSFAALERHRSDVASQVWLEGWSRRCQGAGSGADELFAEAAAFRPDLKAPAADAKVLVIAETGSGPRKAATGQYSEKLVIREGSIGNDKVVAVLGNRRADLVEGEDLFFQATTRGGRQMDNILAEKASTKEATQNFGSAAMTAGMATMGVAGVHGHNDSGSRAAGAAGAAVMLIGLLATASASAMNPAADTRAWDTLPHSIQLAALPEPPGGLRLEAVDFLDGSGRSVLPDRSAVRMASYPACSVVWVGATSLLPSRTRPVAAEPEQPVIGGKPCRTPSGVERVMLPDICRRIGGTPGE